MSTKQPKLIKFKGATYIKMADKGEWEHHPIYKRLFLLLYTKGSEEFNKVIDKMALMPDEDGGINQFVPLYKEAEKLLTQEDLAKYSIDQWRRAIQRLVDSYAPDWVRSARAELLRPR